MNIYWKNLPITAAGYFSTLAVLAALGVELSFLIIAGVSFFWGFFWAAIDELEDRNS